MPANLTDNLVEVSINLFHITIPLPTVTTAEIVRVLGGVRGSKTVEVCVVVFCCATHFGDIYVEFLELIKERCRSEVRTECGEAAKRWREYKFPSPLFADRRELLNQLIFE
jgi:hypothetical protein